MNKRWERGKSSARLPAPPGAGPSEALGSVGRTLVPGVAEGEIALTSAAYAASSSTLTAPLVTPLLTAAQALPVAAGVGVVGAGAGHAARMGAAALGASEETANVVGFETAVLTGAALGSFIPGVGTAVGAGVGAVVAGAFYLWTLWKEITHDREKETKVTTPSNRTGFWNDQVWASIDDGVTNSMGAIRVAQNVFPTEPLPNTTSVPADVFDPEKMSIVEGLTRPYVELAVEFPLTNGQVNDDPTGCTAITLSKLAAKSLALAEDGVILQGRDTHLPRGVRIESGEEALGEGLLGLAHERRITVRRPDPHAPTNSGGEILRAIAEGIALLTNRGAGAAVRADRGHECLRGYLGQCYQRRTSIYGTESGAGRRNLWHRGDAARHRPADRARRGSDHDLYRR